MAEVSFTVGVVDGVPVVIAPEEIDAANAAGLRAALRDAAGQGTRRLVVDMSQTQFCDSSGLTVLVRAHQDAQARGGELVLVVSAAAVLRMLALTGADRVIPNFAALDEALGQPPNPAVHPPAPVT